MVEGTYASDYLLGLLGFFEQINTDTETIVQIVAIKGNHSISASSYYGYYGDVDGDDLSEHLNQTIQALFFDNACPQESCATACDGDFATMFHNTSLYTLHNCLLAPYLAVANLTTVNEAFLKDRYALGPALNVTASNVVYQVNGKPFHIEICEPS